MAALSMALAVTDAGGRRMEASFQEYLLKWEGAAGRWLTFADEGGHRISCELTLDGSFHSKTLSKVSGLLVGYITGAELVNCQGGSARALSETLPWHVQYNSFTGTLPNITRVADTIVGVRINIEEAGGIGCLFGTTQASPAWLGLAVSSGRVTSVTALREHRIPLTGFVCSFVSPEIFEGTGIADRGSTLESITIRLVQ